MREVEEKGLVEIAIREARIDTQILKGRYPRVGGGMYPLYLLGHLYEGIIEWVMVTGINRKS